MQFTSVEDRRKLFKSETKKSLGSGKLHQEFCVNEWPKLAEILRLVSQFSFTSNTAF